MAKEQSEKTAVKGGWVARSVNTGRFLAVGTTSGVSRRKPKTEEVLSEISAKRSAALKRLADR